MSTNQHPYKFAVFSFGRMNPPTVGHKAMITYGMKLANEMGGDYFLFPSHSVDKQPKRTPLPLEKYRNPLTYPTKHAFLSEVFPDVNIINNPEIKSPQQVTLYLASQGYNSVTFVVGSDRVQEFENRWLIYTPEYFWQAQVVSAGTRDENSDGIEGTSASKARTAAIANDLDDFQIATGWDADLSKRLFTAVRDSMGLVTDGTRQSVQDQIISSQC